MDAISLRYISGTKVEIDPPAKTPNKVARINAEAEPKKTAQGFVELPLSVNVAI